MARDHRWACQEKRRELDDLDRLAGKLRTDRERIIPLEAGVSTEQRDQFESRREKLNRTIANIDAAVGRVREELDAAERELAQVEQMTAGRPAGEIGSVPKRPRRRAAWPRSHRP